MNPEVKWLMDYLDEHAMIPEMQTTLNVCKEWSGAHFNYASKAKRILEWSPSESDLYDIICHIFAGVILNPEGMTYQALIGYIAGNVACKDPLDRAKCAAELIAIAYQCDLVVITEVSDKTKMVTTEFELPVEIPEFLTHKPEFKPIQEIDYNPILGSRFKQHDDDVCLDHINRMNAIPLCLDFRVINGIEETPSSEFETDEQQEQWDDFLRRSQRMYALVESQENRFFLRHDYDTRGRCYCDGYYVNYQGASFKKAIIQLADKEVVQL